MNDTFNIGDSAAVIAGLVVLGKILKTAWKSFPNRYIPLVTLVGGTLTYVASTGGWSDSRQWIAGVMTALTGTGLHSSTKNILGLGNEPISKIENDQQQAP